MPKPYPKEFRDDVVRVALNWDAKTTITQIAKVFGVREGTVTKWIRQAEVDAGTKPGTTTDESAEWRELRRRTRLLEQERCCAGRQPICLRRICRQKALPAPKRACRRRDPRGGDVPGIAALPPALLSLAQAAHHRH